MADIGQIDMGKMMRRYGKEETVRMMKEIMENNENDVEITKTNRGVANSGRERENKTSRIQKKRKRTGRDRQMNGGMQKEKRKGEGEKKRKEESR